MIPARWTATLLVPVTPPVIAVFAVLIVSRPVPVIGIGVLNPRDTSSLFQSRFAPNFKKESLIQSRFTTNFKEESLIQSRFANPLQCRVFLPRELLLLSNTMLVIAGAEEAYWVAEEAHWVPGSSRTPMYNLRRVSIPPLAWGVQAESSRISSVVYYPTLRLMPSLLVSSRICLLLLAPSWRTRGRQTTSFLRGVRLSRTSLNRPYGSRWGTTPTSRSEGGDQR